MKTRQLGADLAVSAMGLGCMGMSEFYGGQDEADAIAQADLERIEAVAPQGFAAGDRDPDMSTVNC
ncbi:MAG: hypothetical protein ACFBSF_05885 [Leptolyngbyaceae cyanobacterium]